MKNTTYFALVSGWRKDVPDITPNGKREIVIQFSGVETFGALLNGLEIIPQ